MARPPSPRQIQVAFGQSVRLIRHKRGLSQEALAELAELHRNYIGSVERGERNLSLVNIWRIAAAVGISPSDLLNCPVRSGQRLTVLSWNTRAANRWEDQIEAVADVRPDVVALQELTPGTIAHYRDGLARQGLTHALDSASLLEEAGISTDALRRKCVLLASRWPMRALPRLAAPWPERYVGAIVSTPQSDVEFHVVHMPVGMRRGNAPDWRKVETFEALYRRLARKSVRHRVLCGDFNAPKAEHRDGPPETWAFERYRPPLTPSERARWHDAELSIFIRLADFGLRDAFRDRHPDAAAASWYSRSKAFAQKQNRDHSYYGRRFDHVFCSPDLRVEDVSYRTDWIDRGLSDHASVVAQLRLAS